MIELNRSKIEEIDKSNMFAVLSDFPGQVKHAIEIGKNADGFRKKTVSNEFAILGMGGSAIGGDILKSYVAHIPGANKLRISTYRNYTLPAYIDSRTNVIASSYSGGTEETISAFSQALGISENILCITTGGKLGSLAEENAVPITKIPDGFQPRCALGYSFFPMLLAVMKTGAFSEEAMEETEYGINETVKLLEEKSKVFSGFGKENLALQLAMKLADKMPVIYSSSDRMDSVNLRWRRQIQENAKTLAFGDYLPEMNHNEINSWSYPAEIVKNSAIIILKDREDNPRTQIRFNAITSLLSDYAGDIITLESNSSTWLARIFDMIYLGDWVSYYIAILKNQDPTPIPLISKLKTILSGS